MATRLNRFSARAMIVLSVIALLTVLTGYFQAPHADEGAAAHIFQISIVLLAPALLLFLATTDWKQGLRSARPLAFSAVVVALAFAALYYLEHGYYAQLR